MRIKPQKSKLQTTERRSSNGINQHGERGSDEVRKLLGEDVEAEEKAPAGTYNNFVKTREQLQRFVDAVEKERGKEDKTILLTLADTVSSLLKIAETATNENCEANAVTSATAVLAIVVAAGNPETTLRLLEEQVNQPCLSLVSLSYLVEAMKFAEIQA